MLIGFSVIVALVLALMGYVRLAPVDVAQWHINLQTTRPPGLPTVPAVAGADPVLAVAGGAYADLATADPAATLARLDATALATPRTRRIAGSVAEGHVTWETRSALWGFPDYTTAQITPSGLLLYARLRFGSSDLGVNAARLRQWLAQL